MDDSSKITKNTLDLKMLTYISAEGLVDTINKGEAPGITVEKSLDVIISTTFGLVTGTYAKYDDEIDYSGKLSEIDSNSYLLNQIFNARSHFISNDPENEKAKLINDSKGIALCDVTIKPYSNMANTIKLQNLILFADQVVGISLGNLNN